MMDRTTARGRLEHAGSGISGLDEVLRGGFQRRRLYLVEGEPGTGKTTLALQFMLDGVRAGETVLYVTLSETEEELHDVANGHGWEGLDAVHIAEMKAPDGALDPERQYTFFHPSEVELGDVMKRVLSRVDELKASRVVFDSLAELRLLANDSMRYRRQVLALKQFLTERNCTTLVLDGSVGESEYMVDTIAHGVLKLEQLAPDYGGQRRRLRLKKVRAENFHDGHHDYVIRPGGLQVFPRLEADQRDVEQCRPSLGSGVESIDALMGGGIERGTSTLLLGPSGVGKSTLASQYVAAAAARGERAVVFLFDERRASWIARAEVLGMSVKPRIDDDTITVEHVNPAALSPGEFASRVQACVEKKDARVVVIDSLNGYEMGMPGERFLALHLNEMFEYLNKRNINAITTLEQHGLVGSGVKATSALTYIADNVVLLRYFEAFGEVRRALSVIKKRSGPHERLIREFSLSAGKGIRVGESIREFSGVLTGTPVYVGSPMPVSKREPS